MFQEQLTQFLGQVDYILPSNAAVASYNSANPIDMSRFKRACYIIEVGAITAGATLDGRLQISANSNMAGSVNVANSNIVQITAANSIASVEIRSDQIAALAAAAGVNYRYLRLNTTVGTNTLLYSAIGLGGDSIQKPGSQFSAAIAATPVVVTP